MGGFGKIGLSVLGAIVFTASSAWAAPFTGASEGVSSWSPFPGSGIASIASISHGYTTITGAVMCHGAGVAWELVQTPTGACRATEAETRTTNNYYCQYEGTGDIVNATATNTTCIPLSCYDENFALRVNCSFTFTESATVTGGSGALAGSSGSWTASGAGTVTQAEMTSDGAQFFTATLSAEMEGDFELADGSVPPAGAALEIPSPGTNVSGVGLVSGWSCLGGELTVEFSDENGAVLDHLTQTVLQGSERIDTEGACGDINNGFSSLFNWARLGSGERTARLIRNGEEIASSTFMVTAFDRDFLSDAEGMCTIPNFPDMGTNATFVWETSQQGLVLESVN